MILYRFLYGDGIGPEAGSVLARLPAFRAHMALESGPAKLVFQRGAEHIVAGVEHGYVLVHRLAGLVPVNAGSSRIPGSDTSFDVQQVQRNLGTHLGMRSAEHALCGGLRSCRGGRARAGRAERFLLPCIDVARRAVGDHQPQCALLLAWSRNARQRCETCGLKLDCAKSSSCQAIRD